MIPPYGEIYANPPNLQLPYTLQWNTSLEQALGSRSSLTLSYVGANGRKLFEEAYSNVAKYNPKFGLVTVVKNGLTSSYNALQLKYQRQVAHGLQALASYTWSHSLDFGSYNAAFPYERGNSDLDVRNNATGALSYDIPSGSHAARSKILLADWGLDGKLSERTGFPISLNGNSLTDPTSGQIYFAGLNIVQNTPFYLHGSRAAYPGGRVINPSAFILPPTSEYGNAPRNLLRGFGSAQMDLAIRRSFPITEKLRLQFRAEAFNATNHPNFGTINATFGNAQFGQATQTLNQSLGVLSPLYQTGGPRSLQFTAKLSY